MSSIQDLFKRLIGWFLGKSNPKLETFEEERIEGRYATLIRYKRKTHRAYRTWRAVYKVREYDIIFGFDTLAYLKGIPSVHKANRLSTHACHIYKQGLHARFNPRRGCHEPDIQSLLHNEVCLEPVYSPIVLQRWRLKSANSNRPIYTTDDLVDLIIDRIAQYCLDQPDALVVNWREVVERITREVLFSKGHQVFPEPRSLQSDHWV